MLKRPLDQHWGLKISDDARLPNGSVYVILARLERLGWVTSQWESIDPAREGRARRRLYTLTGAGVAAARDAVAAPGLNRKTPRARVSPGVLDPTVDSGGPA